MQRASQTCVGGGFDEGTFTGESGCRGASSIRLLFPRPPAFPCGIWYHWDQHTQNSQTCREKWKLKNGGLQEFVCTSGHWITSEAYREQDRARVLWPHVTRLKWMNLLEGHLPAAETGPMWCYSAMCYDGGSWGGFWGGKERREKVVLTNGRSDKNGIMVLELWKLGMWNCTRTLLNRRKDPTKRNRDDVKKSMQWMKWKWPVRVHQRAVEANARVARKEFVSKIASTRDVS